MRNAGLLLVTVLMLARSLALAQTPQFFVLQLGEDLHHNCKDFDSEGRAGYRNGFCEGYIAAHYEDLSPGFDWKSGKIVVPSSEQLVAVVNKYLNAHPELWSKPASDIVRDALFETFSWARPHSPSDSTPKH